ncbi:NosD domain-containing protein [Actinomadura nitritigenes]|uniref:NosD domain-containing protein n=1 Tax=Actinomadura nitritigenes TaxID=134602 RepID=UPI003D90343E
MDGVLGKRNGTPHRRSQTGRTHCWKTPRSPKEIAIPGATRHPRPRSTGCPVTQSRRVALVGTVAADNLGKGVWLDESVYDATLTGDRILRNASHGVALELSAKVVVTHSVISGNGDDGLKVNNTSDARIEGNTLAGNGRTIDLAQDPRSPDRPGATGVDPRHAGDPAMTWRIEKITVRGNTLATPRPGTPCLLCVDHVARKGPTGAAEITLDGNAYRRSDSSTPRSLIVWTDQAGVTSRLLDLARFRSATGQEKHGRLDNT